MKNLSIAQEYALLTLNDKGVFSSLSLSQTSICLMVSAISDLCLRDVVTIDEKKKLSIATPLPDDLKFLKPLYDYVASKSPIKSKKVVEEYTMGFPKKFNELFNSICDDLSSRDCVSKEEKSGLLGGKTRYYPDKNKVESVIQQIRVEVLEAGNMSEDIMILCGILDRGNQLKHYFSKHESQLLKEKIQQFRQTDASILAKSIMDELGAIVAIIASI